MRVLFFAQLREVTGIAQAEIEADGVDADSLWSTLAERWPGLSEHRRNTRLARNGTYAAPGEVFRANDEVALIPPVSGG
jgi:molybdopterin synthase sulfur carrier subunit